MNYQAWFQCTEGCDERYPLNEVIYQCKKCGGLLEVQHDTELLKKKPGHYWSQLFDRRYVRNDYPYGSSVWGKKELVNPMVKNENIISTLEGASNLFWAERFGKELGMDDLWVKMCGNSHTGSFKDLGMTVLVSQVKQIMSEGKPVKAVACASTGDTSASLAAYCAAAGILAIVILPANKISHAQLIQPIANGALTLALETDFDGCMKIVQEITKDHEIYLANSMNSLRIEGQKTVAIEIVQQFDWEPVDWVVIPGGNLGNVSALVKGFQMMVDLGLLDRLPRVACAQAQKANPLYESYLTGFNEYHPKHAEKTLASAIQIGNPVSYKKAVRALQACNGVVEEVTEDELANAAARADRTGLFTCPHTGVAVAALIKLLDKGIIDRKARTIVVSTANGLKFPEFKIRYHEDELEEVKPRYRNLPVPLPPEADAVRRTIDKRLEAGF
jgi:threonine synthase